MSVVHDMAIQSSLCSSHLLVGVVSYVCSHKDALPRTVATSIGGCSEGQWPWTSFTAPEVMGFLFSSQVYSTGNVLLAQIEVNMLHNG